MHKYITLFFSAALFLCACNGKPEPKDVLKPEAMARVLTEMHIIDGTMYNVMQTPDSLYKYGAGKYAAMFTRMHTSAAQFNKSMQFYGSQPDKLLAIYDQVDVTIKAKMDSLNKVQVNEAKAARKADSLKNLNIKTKTDSARKVISTVNRPALNADSLRNVNNKAKAEMIKRLRTRKANGNAKPAANPNI
ncbi:DUF4296 domain-containing protein [Mucilaginibacter celer]|uniref:DUF4296 domain-containing protein n=1 Tax=Mucilaginibacter celer TaxID=2305508 RepID=A0A494VSX3_9SPHI|nr:DUF4296 domain-containing protein [Mucilaginibacter celer]AYL96510.1 DUF4296 domain-containing protein [Mucilaginibacter celer]